LESLDQGRSLCLIKNISGYNCPGCGTTRAISAVLKGKFATAFSYNRFIIITFPLLAWLVFKELANSVYTVWSWVLGKRKADRPDMNKPCHEK